MEKARAAEDDLARLGKTYLLAILQQLKEAGRRVELNELKKTGNYSEPSISHRLRELEVYGLIKMDVKGKEGIFYSVSEKGILVLESALETHDLFSEP